MAYKTFSNGRRLSIPRGATNGIQYCVALEGTIATFECKRGGHRHTKDFSKDRRSSISAEVLRKMARYWGLGVNANGIRGHCYGWCQKCQNEADGVAVAVKVKGDRP